MDTPFLTRKQIVEAARTELGVPLAQSTIDKAAMLGVGPKPAAKFGRNFLYEKKTALDWVRSLIAPIESHAS